jgi:hypothetical protein
VGAAVGVETAGMKRKRNRKWPITLWWYDVPEKYSKRRIIDLISSGLFPELEAIFPELAHHYKGPK